MMNKDVAEISQTYQVTAAEQVVPKGYKQTEVGVIPEDWEVYSVQEVLDKGQLGGNYANSEMETDYPLIKMGNLGRGNIKLDKLEYVNIKVDEKDRLNFGDVLFNTRNTLELVGKVAIWRDELPKAYFNSNLMRLSFNKDLVANNFYINTLMNTKRFISDLAGIATGTTSVAAIYTRDLKTIKIVLPSIKEQTAIANALSDVDALLSELEKLIAKKQAIKTASMQQLLTGRTRLPQFAQHQDGSPKGYKQSELGEIPEGWDIVELGSLLSYEQPTKYLVATSEYLELGTTPVLTAGKSFVLGYTAETHNLFTSLPVIIFDDFTTDSKYVDFNFKAKSSAMKMLKPKNSSTPLKLIFHILNSVDFKVGDHKRHWISEFSKLKVIWPTDAEEQTVLATILTDFDDDVQALRHRLNKTRQIKQGMMQQLLTGKIRLLKPAQGDSNAN